jgi:hypothetical protein
MIKAEFKKGDLKRFYKKMDKLIKELPKGVESGVKMALEDTKNLAIQIKGSGKSNQGILVEIIDRDKNEITGRVYTDVKKFPYLVYLEYGTGLYADPEGGGSRAKKIPWFVHVSMADLSRYNYQIYTAPDGEQFYIVYGMHPRPYMRPAGFQSRDANLDKVQEQIYETLRRVL